MPGPGVDRAVTPAWSRQEAMMQTTMPDAIAGRLDALCVRTRSPAYLLTDAAGHVLKQGGLCERYGFGPLDRELPVGHQLDFLEGALPLNGESVVLPFVQVANEVYADLHLFSTDEGDWVLFLDSTALAMRLFDVQQNTNELSLLRREQTNMIAQIRRSHAALLSILNQLQIVTAIVDGAEQLTFLSDNAERLLAMPPREALGRPWERVLPLAETDKVRLRTLMKTSPEKRQRLTVAAVTAHGRHFALEIDVRDDPGEPGHHLLYMYDVTEIFDLRRQLEGRAVFHDMVGATPSMRAVFDLIRDVAAVDATVLIEGETGTGKDLVARAIHFSSPRRDKPLVVVNAAGLSDSLINSQLFGHKKGAFTDAVSDQEGFFEAADGGTIFLDEIGDIPMNTQTRILRALEQKEVTRIGETKARKVDVRILAATNKDLNAEVAQGNFRADLLYRLRVARIRLPTLRERREDLPALVELFLRQACEATGKKIVDIDQIAMRAILDYGWPGNVRELKNALAFAAIHCKGSSIRIVDLPPELTDGSARRRADTQTDVDAEKEQILRALETAGGRRDEAARLLGIGRATLYRRMKACFITPGDLPKRARWNARD